MKKVYKTMGATNSWQQNKRSPKLTIFRSRRLTTKLVGMCRAVNSRNLPKEAAEADNIMKFKNNLYKLNGQQSMTR